MKHPKAISLKEHLDRVDNLLTAYATSTVPKYKVKVIVVDKVSQYHVVNIQTNVSHSVWMCYDKSMEVMRDLNRMARKVA